MITVISNNAISISLCLLDASKRLQNLKKKKVDLESTLKLYKENDPEYLKEVQKDTNISRVSANRWTDNIFALHSWISNHFPSISLSDLNKQFGVPDDLDYVD